MNTLVYLQETTKINKKKFCIEKTIIRYTAIEFIDLLYINTLEEEHVLLLSTKERVIGRLKLLQS